VFPGTAGRCLVHYHVILSVPNYYTHYPKSKCVHTIHHRYIDILYLYLDRVFGVLLLYF
jgi:hypothetical protein